MKVDKNGMIQDGRILLRRFSNLEHGALNQVNAIVVHQTDSSTDQSTFNCYSNPSRQEGAHFLIGVMGTIYQTASIKCCCYHVGKLRSRCMVLGPKGCADAVAVKIAAMNTKPSMKATLTNAHEVKKPYPERYPMNKDSLGAKPTTAPAATPRCAPVTGVSDRSVLADARQAHFYVVDINHPEDPTCKQDEIPLTNSTAQEFFRRARITTMREIHDHYDWLE